MINIFFADVRDNSSHFLKRKVSWQPGMTAFQAIQLGLGTEQAMQVSNDLENDSTELTVSWNRLTTDEHSEIGGVGSLNWELEDDSVLTIVYESEATSSMQEEEMINWMLENKPV